MKFAFAAALVAAVQAVEIESTWSKYPVSGQGYGGHYAQVDRTPVTKLVQPAFSRDRAQAGYGKDQYQVTIQDWDAYGRDQDLAIDESYGQTHAKSYNAESYDEWDNKDNDQWGAQAWGKDRDLKSRSSAAAAASDKHKQQYGAGAAGAYGARGQAQYGSYGAASGFAAQGGYSQYPGGHGKGWNKAPIAPKG